MTAPPLLFDLPGRGAIVLTGKDRAAFLHRLVTNDVAHLAPGRGCAAAFLTPKGKLLATCAVLCEDGRLVLDTEPELAMTVEALLKKYLVFDDVAIANETAETHVLHLTAETTGDAEKTEGFLRRVIGLGADGSLPRKPHESDVAQFTFSEIPGSPGAAVGGASTFVIVRENRTGVPGWDLRCPASLSEEISSSLLSFGARLATHGDMEARRIAAGIPRWGAELTEAVLPDEAGLREGGFVAENKGCYVGQEIVARLKTYGHVNRRLVRLAVTGGVPARGDRAFFEGEPVGVLTSIAPAGESGAIALAYVKRERVATGTLLTISASETTSGALPATVLGEANSLV